MRIAERTGRKIPRCRWLLGATSSNVLEIQLLFPQKTNI